MSKDKVTEAFDSLLKLTTQLSRALKEDSAKAKAKVRAELRDAGSEAISKYPHINNTRSLDGSRPMHTSNMTPVVLHAHAEQLVPSAGNLAHEAEEVAKCRSDSLDASVKGASPLCTAAGNACRSYEKQHAAMDPDTQDAQAWLQAELGKVMETREKEAKRSGSMRDLDAAVEELIAAELETAGVEYRVLRVKEERRMAAFVEDLRPVHRTICMHEEDTQ